MQRVLLLLLLLLLASACSARHDGGDTPLLELTIPDDGSCQVHVTTRTRGTGVWRVEAMSASVAQLPMFATLTNVTTFNGTVAEDVVIEQETTDEEDPLPLLVRYKAPGLANDTSVHVSYTLHNALSRTVTGRSVLAVRLDFLRGLPSEEEPPTREETDAMESDKDGDEALWFQPRRPVPRVRLHVPTHWITAGSDEFRLVLQGDLPQGSSSYHANFDLYYAWTAMDLRGIVMADPRLPGMATIYLGRGRGNNQPGPPSLVLALPALGCRAPVAEDMMLVVLIVSALVIFCALAFSYLWAFVEFLVEMADLPTTRARIVHAVAFCCVRRQHRTMSRVISMSRCVIPITLISTGVMYLAWRQYAPLSSLLTAMTIHVILWPSLLLLIHNSVEMIPDGNDGTRVWETFHRSSQLRAYLNEHSIKEHLDQMPQRKLTWHVASASDDPVLLMNILMMFVCLVGVTWPVRPPWNPDNVPWLVPVLGLCSVIPAVGLFLRFHRDVRLFTSTAETSVLISVPMFIIPYIAPAYRVSAVSSAAAEWYVADNPAYVIQDGFVIRKTKKIARRMQLAAHASNYESYKVVEREMAEKPLTVADLLGLVNDGAGSSDPLLDDDDDGGGGGGGDDADDHQADTAATASDISSALVLPPPPPPGIPVVEGGSGDGAQDAGGSGSRYSAGSGDARRGSRGSRSSRGSSGSRRRRRRSGSSRGSSAGSRSSGGSSGSASDVWQRRGAGVGLSSVVEQTPAVPSVQELARRQVLHWSAPEWNLVSALVPLPKGVVMEGDAPMLRRSQHQSLLVLFNDWRLMRRRSPWFARAVDQTRYLYDDPDGVSVAAAVGTFLSLVWHHIAGRTAYRGNSSMYLHRGALGHRQLVLTFTALLAALASLSDALRVLACQSPGDGYDNFVMRVLYLIHRLSVVFLLLIALPFAIVFDVMLFPFALLYSLVVSQCRLEPACRWSWSAQMHDYGPKEQENTLYLGPVSICGAASSTIFDDTADDHLGDGDGDDDDDSPTV